MHHTIPVTGATWVHSFRQTVITLCMLVFLVLPATALAQNFDGDRFLEQCLRLEAGGDYISARESCLNALELDPAGTDILLALARLEIRLGELSSAENRLLQLRARVATAEPALLLADVALARGDTMLAESYLDGAAQQLANNPNAELVSRQSWLLGRTLENRGELQEALGHYRRAAATQPLEAAYYRSAAGVLMQLGLPDAAVDELLQYRTASGERGDAELHSMLGQAQWAAGRLEAAATEYEAAFALRAGRNAEAQASDLRNLTAIYYGMGDIPGGNAALGDALGQGNLVRLFAGNSLMWLLLLLVIAGLHLISESRIQEHRTIEAVEGPQMWSVASIYSVLVVSALLGLLAVILWSVLVLENWAAAFTPLQAGQIKAVFLIVFSLSSVLGSWITARRHGWRAGDVLLGRSEHMLSGVVVGAALVAVAILWQRFVPAGLLGGNWHFELKRLSGLTLAAVVLLPFSELFFRSFAIPALDKRYSGNVAVVVAGGLYALVLGTPVVLSVVLGVILGAVFLRSRSGLLVVTAQLVLQLGLVLLHMVWTGLSTFFA